MGSEYVGYFLMFACLAAAAVCGVLAIVMAARVFDDCCEGECNE